MGPETGYQQVWSLGTEGLRLSAGAACSSEIDLPERTLCAPAGLEAGAGGLSALEEKGWRLGIAHAYREESC